MSRTRSVVTWVGVVAATALGVWLLGGPSARLAAAQPAPANPSGAASVAPSASGGPEASGTASAPPSPRVRLSMYSWPTDASAEPTDAEWASATALDVQSSRSRILLNDGGCAARAVREWVRITCPSPDRSPSEEGLIAVVLGMAGDFSGVKAQMVSAETLAFWRDHPDKQLAGLLGKAGASATLTFQAKPGTAFIVSFMLASAGRGGWEDTLNLSTLPCPLLSVSWAKGEKAPSISVR